MKNKYIKFIFFFLAAFFSGFLSTYAQDRHPKSNVIYPKDAFYQNGGRIIDVTQPPFNAKGDGITDDTEAINAAYTVLAKKIEKYGWQSGDSNNGSYMLYFPSGTYLVSNTIIHNLGNISYTGQNNVPEGVTWVRFVGQNRDNTIIKLKDNSPGFGPGTHKELISLQKKGVGNREGNNIPAANQISDLTINTGSGNPGAVGVYWMSANSGEMSNVLIKSDDGQGYAGIDMPVFSVQGYYRDITIEGFDYGIRAATRGENNPTFEYISFKDQNKAAVLAEDGSPIFRMAKSTNAVPFAIIDQDESQVLIIDSKLNGTDTSVPAVDLQNDKSQLFIRNTEFSGYGASVKKNGKNVVTGNIDEYVSSEVQTLFEGFEKKSLNLPIAESPIMKWEQDMTQWANVDSFPGDSDAERVQNAMNSGKPVIYFPKSEYDINTTITIPKTVKFLDFMYSRPSNGTTFNISESSSDNLYIYHVNRCLGNLIQTASRPVVMRNVSFDNYSYKASTPSQLYLESIAGFGSTSDFCPAPLTIWGRSINDENKNTSCFKVYGGTLWTMGFKTESVSAAFDVRNGGSAEVLGGFRNEVGKTGDGPFVYNENSNVSFVGYNHLAGKGYPVVTEIQNGTKQKLLASRLPMRGSGAVMLPLYVGTTDASAPACLPILTANVETGLNKAQLHWNNPNEGETSFEVRYKKLKAPSYKFLEEVKDTAVTVSGLEEGANYEWQVRGKCGDDYSDFSAPAFFTTDLSVDATNEKISIDGKLDEIDWNLNTKVTKVLSGDGNNDATYGLLWDNKYLYIGVKVLDDNLVNDSDKAFQDDAVELFIDPENDGGKYGKFDYQIIKGYDDDDLFISKDFNGEILHKTTKIEGGYVVEMAVPWVGLGIVPGNNLSIGFDVGIDDDDDGDKRDGQNVWSGSGLNFKDASSFGDILLKNGLNTTASLGLYFTWDFVTTDEVTSLSSNLGAVASFTGDAAKGSGSIAVMDEDGNIADAPALSIAKESLLNESFNLRSYSLWFKARDTKTKQFLFEEGGQVAGVVFQLENDELSVIFRHGPGADFTKVSVPFVNKDEVDWNHLAVTFEAGIVGVYINGKLAGSGIAPVNTIPKHNNTTSLGGINPLESASNGDNYYFNGSLDELKVFNGVLSKEKIAELAERPISIPPAILGLHFTWDNKTVDEVAALESSLGEGLVSYSNQTPFGSKALEVSGAGIPANNPAIAIAKGSLLNQSFTNRSYSLWVKARNTKDKQVLFEEGGDLGGVVFQLQNDNLLVIFRHGGGNNFTTMEVPFPAAKDNPDWTHIAVTYNVGNITVYINGKKVGLIAATAGTIPAHNNPASLGGIRNNQAPTNDDTNYFDGFLDEFRVYNGVLTDEEVLKLFQAFTDSTGVNLHWPLEETTGTFVKNIAGPGNDGNILGGTADNITSKAIVGNGFLFAPNSPTEGEVVVLKKHLIKGYPLSTSMWVNASQSQFSQVLTIADTTTNRNHISLGITNLTLEDGSKGLQPFMLIDDNKGKAKRVNAEQNIADGWHHITMVLKNPTSRKLYIDGQLAVEDDVPVDYLTFDNQRLSLGGSLRGTFDGNRYKGKLDEFQLFNTAISEDKISSMRVEPKSIKSASSMELPIDSTKAYIQATLLPVFSKQGLSYASSKPEVVEVGEKGLLKPLSAGTSIVTVSATSDPGISAMVEVTVTSSLSLGGYTFELKQYPNPTTGILNIEGGALNNGPIQVKVYTMQGKFVLGQALSKEGTIDIEGLPKGLYIVQLKQNGKVVLNSKVIKK